MSFIDLLLTQLTDPFRIGLIVMLLLTASSTAAQTGTMIPLVLGIVFVAVLIPSAFGSDAAGMASAIGVGLVSNAILVGILLAAKSAWRRLAGGSKASK